jgi:murein L,D-transpeptidase YcbB/YkuD
LLAAAGITTAGAGVFLVLLLAGTPTRHATDQRTADQLGEEVPPSPTLIVLRQMLPKLEARADADDLAAMTSFYRERTALLWVSDRGLSDKGRAVIDEIRRADDWGLRSRDFALPQLNAAETSPAAAAEAEITLTLSALKYARYARGGRIRDPSRISKLLDHTPPIHPPKLVLADLVTTDTPDAYLRGLHPKHEEFERLRQLLLKLRRADGKGELGASNGEKEFAFGERLQGVVPQSQRANSWDADVKIENVGLNAQPTPEAENIDPTIDRILVNMERWRWLAPDLGTLYVWDNVPEFLTRVVKNGRVVHTDEIIVGQRTWPTPIFSADMKTIAFHPTWGVPDGIKAKELAPLLRKSSGGGLFGIFGGGYSAQAVLDAYDLRAYSNGRQVNANSVDWGNVDIRRYSFQQPPGPKNPLGTVKFMFPNAHDVYMHDTPERNLFAKSFRALSHGCMRVHEPRRLAEILLAEDKGWSASKVGSMYSGSNEVRLDKHIPVHVTYFTARVDEDGKLRTFGDFYGLDGPVGTALLGRKVRFETPRYDDEPVQQDRRAQSFQGQTSGAPNLVDFISNIFSP